MTEPSTIQHASPSWGATTKLVVGLTIVAIVAALFARFQTLLGPLVLAFMLTYLLHPIAKTVSNSTPLTWRMAVNLMYIILVILLISLFTATGFAVVGQFQSLVNVIERFLTSLPDMLTELSTESYVLGPLRIDMSQYLSADNLTRLAEQVLSAAQPILGQAGGLLATVASGTVATIAWGLFVIMVSYFLLVDMARVSNPLQSIEIPGYDSDIRRLARELELIWDAFLRGQMILFTLALFVFSLVLSALGTRFFLALALLTGLARFVPYIGAPITWTVIALVTYFQAGNYLGLVPWQYTLVVIGFVIIIDNIFDNLVSPRILGHSLGVHPAAVLVAAIIAANLLGLVGVVLAAPVLATLLLAGRYTFRKMLDLDPWPEPELEIEPVVYPWVTWGSRINNWITRLKQRRKKDKPE